MASYVVPQVEVHQLFSELPVALARNQVAFAFGPNYILHRYEDENERASTYVGEFNGGTNSKRYVFPGALDPEKIDDRYTKLFFDDALVKLPISTESCALHAIGGEFGGENSGDVITISGSEEEMSILARELTPGRSLGIKQAENDGVDYTVKVLKVKEVTIEDTGSSPSEEVLLGLEVTINEEIIAAPGVATEFVVYEVQDNVEIDARALYDENKTTYQWTVDYNEDSEEKTMTVEGVKVKIVDGDYAGEWGEVKFAQAYITFRELSTAASDTIHSVSTASEVEDALGTISPDNPLAQAVYNVALNAGGQMVRYMAVPTDDKDGYSAVLNAATLTKEVYFLVPVTRESGILDLVKAHCLSMSAPTTKRWRIAFVSAEISEEDAIYTALNNTDGKDFMAKVISTDDKYTVVQFGEDIDGTWIPNKDTRFRKDLVEDDILRTNFHQEWGKLVPDQFVIKNVVNNNTIRVYGKIQPTLPPTVMKAEVYHPYTNAQKAEVIRNTSSHFAERRVYNIFPTVFDGNSSIQTGEFAAACVAGLVSSCLPQQPVTNMELTGIDNIPQVYRTFSYDQLNTMASGGTFIVMQDLPDDQVYVRHQISTAYEDNNLNTAELSITKNLDSISYFMDDLLSPYIGKYNITPELLDVLRCMIGKGLVSLESNSYGLFGPQIIAEGTEIIRLEQDALLKDHVNCDLQLNLPYPFNHLVLKLFV